MRFLWQLLSTVTLWKEHWALGCIFTHIFHFSNVSYFSKILTLKSFSNLWGNWCTEFVKLDVKYFFTCGDSNLSKIIEKCENIMTRIVWKFTFSLYSSNDDSTFWKKHQFWLTNFSLLRKKLISRVQSFLSLSFDPIQGCKIVLTKNH